MVALLYLNTANPRKWTTDELMLVQDVAERTWTAVQKARAEIELREIEGRFRIIAESLPALVWIVTPDLELTFTNDRWVRFSGFPKEHALGHSWMTTIYPPTWSGCRQEIVPIRQQELPYETEVRYRSAEGEYRWHLIRAAPFYGAHRRIPRMVRHQHRHPRHQTNRHRPARKRRETFACTARARNWRVRPGRSVRQGDMVERAGKAVWLRAWNLPGKHSPDGSSTLSPRTWSRQKRAIREAMARRDPEIMFSHRIALPDGAIRNIEVTAKFFYDADGNPLRMIGVNIDVTRYKQAEERQHLLIRELHHRVKNTLATVQAIVGSTARSTSSIDEFYQSFVGRIVSLARTHNLLTEDYWQKASLGDLIRTELGPYDDEAQKRVFILGPPVELTSEAAVPIGMAIHELTTNAAKHGALSTFGGKVDVHWSVEEREGRPDAQLLVARA